MEAWHGILIFALVVLVVALSKTLFSEKNKIYRKFKSHKVSLIKNAYRDQVVRIVGSVKPLDDNLYSPLSKTPCSHYKVRVDMLVSSGKSQHFKKVFEQEKKSSYLIKQDSSYLIINSDNIKSYIKPITTSNFGIFNKNKVDYSNFLDEQSIKKESFFGSKNRFRFREGILSEGSIVSVLGKARFRDADELGLNSRYGRILEIQAMDDGYVYLSNDSRLTNFKSANFNPSEFQRIS